MDIGSISDMLRQFMGAIFAAFGIETATGQGLLKFVDLFELKLQFFANIFESIGSLFGGLAG